MKNELGTNEIVTTPGEYQDPVCRQPGAEHHRRRDEEDLREVRSPGRHRRQEAGPGYRKRLRLHQIREPRHGL